MDRAPWDCKWRKEKLLGETLSKILNIVNSCLDVIQKGGHSRQRATGTEALMVTSQVHS